MDKLLIHIIVVVAGFSLSTVFSIIIWQLKRLIDVTKDNSAELAKGNMQTLSNSKDINNILLVQKKHTTLFENSFDVLDDLKGRVIKLETII